MRVQIKWSNIPTCFKVCTSSCHTGVWDRGRSSGARLGRPGMFPALILVYFIKLGKSTLNGHLRTHPKQNSLTVFGMLNTETSGLVSLLLSRSESCTCFTSLLSWNKDNYLYTEIKFGCSTFLYSIRSHIFLFLYGTGNVWAHPTHCEVVNCKRHAYYFVLEANR